MPCNDEIDRSVVEAAQLRRRLDQARRALTFYADPGNYSFCGGPEPSISLADKANLIDQAAALVYHRPIDRDAGMLARSALRG